MPRLNLYLRPEEKEFTTKQGPGWLRDLVRREMLPFDLAMSQMRDGELWATLHLLMQSGDVIDSEQVLEQLSRRRK